MVAPILKDPPLANRARPRTTPRRCALLALAQIAALSLACGDAAKPGAGDRADARASQPMLPTPLLVGNQLRNPGFEAGTEGWGRIEQSKIAGFEVVSEPVRSGQRAAHIVASWQPGKRERPVSVRSAAQEISPPRFPDRISGWYRVERWEDESRAGALQLQIIVVAIGDPRTREIVKREDVDSDDSHAALDNFQLRYQLAGPTGKAEDAGNARYRIVGEGPPDLGSWQHFDLPVRSDFEQVWGSAPENYQVLRILFAVRWDDKDEGAAIHADVYYDDLFFGFEDL